MTGNSLATIASARACDALDALGLRNQVIAGLQSLVPNSPIVGRAATVAFAPVETDSPEPYDDAIAYIDALRPGAVAVVATNADKRTAYWGELFSAAAIGRGCIGVVTDGCIRDTAGIARLGFPAYHDGTRPFDYRARMKVYAVDSPVSLRGVLVSPDDIIVADNDGVVVVPSHAWEDVTAKVRDRSRTESAVLDELIAGATLRTVWDKYHVL